VSTVRSLVVYARRVVLVMSSRDINTLIVLNCMAEMLGYQIISKHVRNNEKIDNMGDLSASVALVFSLTEFGKDEDNDFVSSVVCTSREDWRVVYQRRLDHMGCSQ